MGHRIPITFIDGPKHGVQSEYVTNDRKHRNGETLPHVLVFQGLIEGRFQILDYEHVPDTNPALYRYRAKPV
jgi:hypothetical protein